MGTAILGAAIGQHPVDADAKANAKVIVFAWVNDENTLRDCGSQSDAYAVFRKILDKGNPPDDCAAFF